MASLSMPAAEPGGFVPTLNGRGYMTSYCDEFMESFITYSASCGRPVLDIGAAYGVATIPCLLRGATVIANDIDSRHLDILRAQVSDDSLSRLTLAVGEFPGDVRIERESLGAALLARVAHFYDGKTLEVMTAALFDTLVPGGKVFLTAETPYLGNWRSFIPIYEERRRLGMEWPGFVSDVQIVVPERGVHLPKTMHLLDPEVLERVFTKAGFIIEQCRTFARPEFPVDIQLDGRESVGLIARRSS